MDALDVIKRIREWRLLDAPDSGMAYKQGLSNLLDEIEKEILTVEEWDGLYFGKFTAQQVDAMTQEEKDYLILQEAELNEDGDVGGILGVILNRYAPNITVCPHCHVDDFTHVEGCDFSMSKDEE